MMKPDSPNASVVVVVYRGMCEGYPKNEQVKPQKPLNGKGAWCVLSRFIATYYKAGATIR